MKTEIYVCTHKKFKYKLSKIYRKLQVGAKNKEKLGYLDDSIGENISEKNANYCELTGLYWMWKNSDADIIGLVHYRRYFYANRWLAALNIPLSKRYIEKMMENYDIIVPKKFHNTLSVYELYERDHHISDYHLVRDVLLARYPEYVETFDCLSSSYDLYLYNMFCTKKHIISSYCDWLFDILFEIESKIDVESYDNYNKRVYGFLAERLFNVWIIVNKLNVKECLVFNIENDTMFGQAIRQPFHLWLNSIIGNKK